MKVRPLPSRERLDELLIFDEHTGEIRWKSKTHNKSRIQIGDIAGTISTHPITGSQYRNIKIDGIIYRAHRLARFYYYGDQPIEVDHANGNSLDNRKCNLRPAPNGLNQKNRGMMKNNTSGVIGVSQRKDGLWLAQYGSVEFRKKHGTTKCFDEFFEAACCRKSWENQYGMTAIKKHRKD